MNVASSASSNMYYHHAYMAEVSELKTNLKNANRMIEEQRLREEERDRQMADHGQQMEEMKKMIKEMSRAQRGLWSLGVRTFQYLICLILHMSYSNSTFMLFVGLVSVTRAH